ncbi:MAG: ATP phosphoribosyltransferase regulatory subunit [Lachnospiraceae bacterium]|nr:ATP phosphoribosyltransferase regulatory subunit [Lachnospiraceae bacterium]
MKEKLLHTPEGVRDIYGEEFITKERAERAVKECMRHYGFLQIMTPAFEYFDIFNSERGTVSQRDMYKFIDRDGETLVLRPDITPQIARCVAKYFRDEELPIRMFYHGNTFMNNDGYRGKLKEITQIGAELVNEGGASADAEMIALMIDCIKSMGLDDFQIEVGNADFFRGLCDAAGFDADETDELRMLIEAKNLFGVEELLSGKKIDETIKELFTGLPLQFGSIDFVREMKKKTVNPRAVSALERIEEIYEKLCMYGKENYVSFDLGMLSKYDYYTGVLFKAYTHKTGEPIAAGGRYDKLLSQFGKPAPAIGIAIYTDYAINAMARQKITPKILKNLTLVLYDEKYEETAVRIANDFRKDGLPATLLKKNNNVSDDEYVRYAKAALAGGILYVDSADSIRILDLESGKIQTKNIQEG